MTFPNTPPRNVLRGLLRQFKNKKEIMNLETQLAPNQQILSKYRSFQSIEPQWKAEELRRIAYEYLILKQDLTERSRLHQLDAGAEEQLSPKELSRRAAARAGLQLPDLNPELN
eukprot:Nitzschia sp. Nitz4//scaffold110_size71422//59744//60085//NITZ4_005883-RA/size71422-processed-gene-0.63-mRNA-1//1//CDS//3329533116//3945//frame0